MVIYQTLSTDSGERPRRMAGAGDKGNWAEPSSLTITLAFITVKRRLIFHCDPQAHAPDRFYYERHFDAAATLNVSLAA
jgi:hypothetical protein